MLQTDAATAAWLAQIPPGQQLAAAAATRAELWSWGLSGAVVALACVALARSGAMAALQARLERGGRRPWLAGAAVAAATTGAVLAADAPFRLLQGRAPAALTAADCMALVAATAIAPAALALARTRPRSWPLWLGLPAAALTFAWAWAPYALGLGQASLPPAPEGPSTAALRALFAQTRLPADTIRLSASRGFDADVTGGFGRAFVSVTRDALKAPPAETAAYVAHLIGHFVHGDVASLALVLSGLVLGGVFAVAAGFRPLARLIGAKGAGRPSDPAGLPVVALILAATAMLGTPLLAGVGRAVNVRADAYALEQTRDPDAMAAMLVRDWDGRAVDPGPVGTAVLYSHPSLAERIRHAMAWKAAK
jgi:STE24 endopeptidase